MGTIVNPYIFGGGGGGGAAATWTRFARHYIKPPLGAGINWGHPLAYGLINCLLFNEGAGLKAHDLARPLTATLAWPGGGNLWGSDRFEKGLDVVGLTSPTVTIPVSDSEYLGELSCIAFVTLRVGGTFHHLFGKSAGNGATNNPLEFRTSNAGSPALQIVTADASNLNSWSTSTTISLGVHHMLAVARPAALNTAPTFYVDGVRCATASGSGSAVTATGTNANIALLRRADGGTNLDGQLTMLLVYKRIVTAAEMCELYINPYQIISPSHLW